MQEVISLTPVGETWLFSPVSLTEETFLQTEKVRVIYFNAVHLQPMCYALPCIHFVFFTLELTLITCKTLKKP